MNLENWLRQKQKEEKKGVIGEWPRNLEVIRAAAEMIWQKPLHHYYTDHSVDHSERVIEKLGRLTEDLTQKDGISSIEVYILLASAYLHDIGMQDKSFEGGNLDQIRSHHHELTRRMIADRYFRQGDGSIPLGMELVPGEIVDTIASVAEAHRQTNLLESRYKEFAYGDQMVHPRLLAALLRLADELDIDHRRVHMQLLSLMDVSAESEFHWCLCYYVSGVQIENGLITVHYQFPEECENYSRIIEPLVREKIQDEFSRLQTILWQHGCKVKMSDEYEMRSIPSLTCMSLEALDIALKNRKIRHTSEIAHHTEEIQFCDSMAQTAPRYARGESLNE